MARKKNRDEFPSSVIRALRERVGGICSNPDCRRFTTGPQKTHKDKPIIIGQAAHICAASPGGPRHDPNMTEAQRSSIENGIWLCNNCAKLIDRDAEKYTVSLLHGWKKESENIASNRLDKQIPGHDDLLNGVALITSQGSCDYENIFIHTHDAYEKYLKAIDPRFDVRVDCISGIRHVKLSNAEGMPPVKLTCAVSDENEIKKLEEMYLFGGEAKISDPDLSIAGSPILERSMQKDGIKHLTMTGNGEDITCKIDIFGKNERKILFSINSKGKLYRGTAGLKFALNALNGLLSLSWNLDFRKDENKRMLLYKTSISPINFDLDSWNRYNINDLDSFYELFEFCNIYSKENMIRFNLKGKQIGTVPLKARICINGYSELLLYLKYINMARIVTAYTGDSIKFSTDKKFTGNQYSKLDWIVKTIKKKAIVRDVVKKISVGNANILITKANYNSFHELFTCNKPTSITIQDDSHEEVTIFDTAISLPLQERRFNNILLKLSDDSNELIVGNKATVEFWPAKNFSYEVRFLKKKAYV